eukprot:5218936-Amphidinium_carterae.2
MVLVVQSWAKREYVMEKFARWSLVKDNHLALHTASGGFLTKPVPLRAEFRRPGMPVSFSSRHCKDTRKEFRHTYPQGDTVCVCARATVLMEESAVWTRTSSV